ncbi:MAG: peptide deformylase [Gemmatimonadales bacterium]|nr:peptide deformylase [Gemmatimonadales bacterium]NIN10751.1 peptide deformylase [Gemmatimonadales bacterium]NIQ98981.1 peptide deformylase [Gemmatimonadales bacterium]NIS63800.1 peptide deformylase [Gemmatimonadales bacterium]
MTVREIHLLGSPVLRQRADEVGAVDGEIRQLVKDLFDTMHGDNGIGLAANQIGIARRVAVVQTEDDDAVVLIDPMIVEREGKIRGEEGCLSIPDIFADVDRAARVVVETTTVENERVRVEANDLASRAIQHEIDHLDGVLFLDHLSPLKRRMLLKKWRKLRKGETGYLKKVSAEAGAPARF